MMGELSEYIRERFAKSSNDETKDLMNKQRVKNSILQVCEKHLQDEDDVLTFEVLPKDLPYVVSVIMEEPLKSRYIINQISNNLFAAKLSILEL